MKIVNTCNSQAQAVLAALEALSEDNADGIEVSVKQFDNCREQGYVVELDSYQDTYVVGEQKHWFAFAEHRNSDDIVVYDNVGPYRGLDSVDWSRCKQFRYGCFTEAATYIYEGIKSNVRKQLQETK